MPTYTDAVGHADDAADALRNLATAVGRFDAPDDVYPILGELCRGLASIEQTLHQLGSLHDSDKPSTDKAVTDRGGRLGQHLQADRTGRAASYRVAWELHRAAEMTHQITAVVERAHELQAGVTYDVHPILSAYRTPAGEPPTPNLSL
ncbi:hypothetical protein [Nocardioides sambongensis]|uniref:hypothetical protein n=1 Tax=Nocardioides sambongensis TaxID=2589074 RepID=UPI00112C280C|nr:hypothetical protein [Nocardioides sambongensis]